MHAVDSLECSIIRGVDKLRPARLGRVGTLDALGGCALAMLIYLSCCCCQCIFSAWSI